MPLFTQPLAKMRITQPFGVDYLGSNGPNGQSYADIGLKNGHNGWDLSALTGTEVYACMDGDADYTNGGQGYGNEMRIVSRELGLEVVYAHLQRSLIGDKPRKVKAGELIARSNNTGFSTGPHLHFGVRRVEFSANGSQVLDYKNGFFGYVDPTPFFRDDVAALAVDKCYGLTPRTKGVPNETEWYKINEWVVKNLKRLLTDREMKALRFGFWDLRTVLDDAMFPIWSEMHKPEAIKRGIVK